MDIQAKKQAVLDVLANSDVALTELQICRRLGLTPGDAWLALEQLERGEGDEDGKRYTRPLIVRTEGVLRTTFETVEQNDARLTEERERAVAAIPPVPTNYFPFDSNTGKTKSVYVNYARKAR